MTQGEQRREQPPARGGGPRTVAAAPGGGDGGDGSATCCGSWAAGGRRPPRAARENPPSGSCTLRPPPPPQPVTTGTAAAPRSAADAVGDADTPTDADTNGGDGRGGGGGGVFGPHISGPHISRPVPPALVSDAAAAGSPAADEPAPERPVSPAAPAPSAPPAVPVRDPRLPVSPAPESSPTLDPRLLLALGRPLHGDSVTRRTGRALRSSPCPSRRTSPNRPGSPASCSSPSRRAGWWPVTSIRGGVGKSTVSALLGRTLNHYRHDLVLTMEADAALGTLPVRMGAEAVRWTCADLAPTSTRPCDWTSPAIWSSCPTAPGCCPPARARSARRSTCDLRQGHAGLAPLLRRHRRRLRVAPRRGGPYGHGHRARPGRGRADDGGGRRRDPSGAGLAARLPHSALAGTVVALVCGAPDTVLDDKAAAGHLRETGVTVVTVPYDRHLAGGGPIRTDLLAQATQHAVLRLAAEVMGRAVRVR